MLYRFGTAAAVDAADQHEFTARPELIEECAGLRLSEFTLDQGQWLLDSGNTDPAVIAVLSGELEVRSDLGSESWLERSVCFYPPGSQVEFQPKTDRALLLRIEVLPRSLENLGGRPACLRRWTHLRSGELSVLAHRIHRELRSFEPESPLAIRGLFLELLSRAAREQVASSHPRPPRCLEHARQIIEERFSESLRIPQIAEEVGVHHVYLARVFRRYLHCSIGEFLRKTRVDWAAEQLAADELSVAEIALMAGFADQSHLTRVFKSVTGLTPARFRNQHRLEITRLRDDRPI